MELKLAVEVPLNPDYGKGCLRRHIAIKTLDRNTIVAALEDNSHAFEMQLQHDGVKVSNISATWHRHPTSTCPGATEQIKELVGCPLSGNVLAHRNFQSSSLHCTHFFDLAGLLIAHAWRQCAAEEIAGTINYCVVVADEVDGWRTASLTKNGQQVLQWEIERNQIQSPAKYKGVPAVKGFTAWAVEHLPTEELEYAFILQMSLFVSMSRRYIVNYVAGNKSMDVGVPLNSCFAMQPPRAEESIKLVSGRDYSHTPEDMLQFWEIKE